MRNKTCLHAISFCIMIFLSSSHRWFLTYSYECVDCSSIIYDIQILHTRHRNPRQKRNNLITEAIQELNIHIYVRLCLFSFASFSVSHASLMLLYLCFASSFNTFVTLDLKYFLVLLHSASEKRISVINRTEGNRFVLLYKYRLHKNDFNSSASWPHHQTLNRENFRLKAHLFGIFEHSVNSNLATRYQLKVFSISATETWNFQTLHFGIVCNCGSFIEQ